MRRLARAFTYQSCKCFVQKTGNLLYAFPKRLLLIVKINLFFNILFWQRTIWWQSPSVTSHLLPVWGVSYLDCCFQLVNSDSCTFLATVFFLSSSLIFYFCDRTGSSSSWPHISINLGMSNIRLISRFNWMHNKVFWKSESGFSNSDESSGRFSLIVLNFSLLVFCAVCFFFVQKKNHFFNAITELAPLLLSENDRKPVFFTFARKNKFPREL